MENSRSPSRDYVCQRTVSRNVVRIAETKNFKYLIMETIQEKQNVNFEKKKIIRRELLPMWIKFFCWFFMILGVLSIFCLIYGAFGNAADLDLYGFKTNRPISIVGIFIIAVALFKGFTAYSLWFEKDNAINLGKIDAIMGIIICFASIFILPIVDKNSHITFRLEILLLIPFYMKLNNIEYKWDNLEEQ
jgi:hypothetical protein